MCLNTIHTQQTKLWGTSILMYHPLHIFFLGADLSPTPPGSTPMPERRHLHCFAPILSILRWPPCAVEAKVADTEMLLNIAGPYPPRTARRSPPVAWYRRVATDLGALNVIHPLESDPIPSPWKLIISLNLSLFRVRFVVLVVFVIGNFFAVCQS